jgi:hypothetical protein
MEGIISMAGSICKFDLIFNSLQKNKIVTFSRHFYGANIGARLLETQITRTTEPFITKINVFPQKGCQN